MRSTVSTHALILSLVFSAFGCKPAPATTPEQGADEPQPQPLPSGVVTDLVTTTSIVREIDQATRMVTLENADGSVVRFRAGPEVANLAQVAVGDEVTVEYYESLAYQVKKASEGAKDTTVEGSTELAPIGDKPGGEEVRVTTLTATIVGIDGTAGTVTLKDPSGALTTVKARDPKNLELVAIGDLVDITITEALAVSVTAAAK